MLRMIAGLSAVGLAAVLLVDDAVAQGRKSNVTMPPPEQRRSQGNLRPQAAPEQPGEAARPEEPGRRDRADRGRSGSRRYYGTPYTGRSYYRPYYYRSRPYSYDYYRPPVYGPGPIFIGPRITPYPYIINPLGQGYRPQYYVPYYGY